MKKLSKLLLLLLVVVLFTACPYSSTVSLEEPATTVKNELLGKWVKISDMEGENPKYYIFEKSYDKLYTVKEYEWNSTDLKYDEKIYSMHVTDIGGTWFLNLKDGETFYFYKIVLDSPMKFTLFEVTDNIDEQFTNQAEMKAFFAKYKDLSFFYNKDEVAYLKEQ